MEAELNGPTGRTPLGPGPNNHRAHARESNAFDRPPVIRAPCRNSS